MKRILKSKIFILLLTIFTINLTSTYFGPSQVYARKPQKTAKPTPVVSMQYIVSLDGLGDFSSIQEAVNHAQDGDSLIIYPGIYTENVEVTGKALHITGIDKNTCILQYDTASYWRVPLTIAAGSVSNLTIYGINNTIQPQNIPADEVLSINEILSPDETLPVNEFSPAIETENADEQILKEIWEHQKNHTGYAIHVDENFSYEKEIKFSNCKIISENNHCVGMGSRGNSNIRFEDCEIISKGNGGCVYLHDCLLPQYQGNVNFTMKNCQLTSYRNPYVMTIESLGSFNPTYLTFQNVKVSSVAFDESECYVPNNINTSFDVDTLLLLEKANLLEPAGLTSSVIHNMVHELNIKESNQYMINIEEMLKNKNLTANHDILPEGITYIKAHKKTDHNYKVNSNENMKKSVLNLQNADGQAGSGWCGLNNVYLTPDSYGNTLIEMNNTSFNGLSQ